MSLDRIRIAKPCPAAWSEMQGDDKVRHCCHCKQNVYNLTAMTRAEAEQLLATRDGRLCLRYFRRDDGRIMTRDCPKGVQRVRNRRLIMTGGLLAFLINVVLASGVPFGESGKPGGDWSTGAMPAERADVTEAIMGKVAVPQPKER